MANLIVAGAAGRMGRLIVSIIVNEKVHRLAGAIESAGNPTIGQDAGEVAGVGAQGIRIVDDYASVARPDTVTLDFTNAAASLGRNRGRPPSRSRLCSCSPAGRCGTP